MTPHTDLARQIANLARQLPRSSNQFPRSAKGFWLGYVNGNPGVAHRLQLEAHDYSHEGIFDRVESRLRRAFEEIKDRAPFSSSLYHATPDQKRRAERADALAEQYATDEIAAFGTALRHGPANATLTPGQVAEEITARMLGPVPFEQFGVDRLPIVGLLVKSLQHTQGEPIRERVRGAVADLPVPEDLFEREIQNETLVAIRRLCVSHQVIDELRGPVRYRLATAELTTSKALVEALAVERGILDVQFAAWQVTSRQYGADYEREVERALRSTSQRELQEVEARYSSRVDVDETYKFNVEEERLVEARDRVYGWDTHLGQIGSALNDIEEYGSLSEQVLADRRVTNTDEEFDAYVEDRLRAGDDTTHGQVIRVKALEAALDPQGVGRPGLAPKNTNGPAHL